MGKDIYWLHFWLWNNWAKRLVHEQLDIVQSPPKMLSHSIFLSKPLPFGSVRLLVCPASSLTGMLFDLAVLTECVFVGLLKDHVNRNLGVLFSLWFVTHWDLDCSGRSGENLFIWLSGSPGRQPGVSLASWGVPGSQLELIIQLYKTLPCVNTACWRFRKVLQANQPFPASLSSLLALALFFGEYLYLGPPVRGVEESPVILVCSSVECTHIKAGLVVT